MRYVVVALMLLASAACVTVSNTLTPDQVATFKLVRVDVAAPPDARVSWGDGEVLYASSRGISPQDAGSVANTPDAQRYVRQTVSAKLKGAFERELAGRLNGTRQVRLEVTVREVDIASALQRIIIGGNHSMRADVALVDARTGAVLSRFPAQRASAAAGQGLGGALIDAAVMDQPIDRVVRNYAQLYRAWLVNE